jgi:DNA (cytosine-5)-methyltransferase 1
VFSLPLSPLSLLLSLTATDIFGGGGGSSEGLRKAGYTVVACANHDPVALHTHQLNHPGALHFPENLLETDYRMFPTTDILWASPSCAKQAAAGGRKRPPADIERARTDPNSVDRATATAVIHATEIHRYRAVIVENVREFRSWSLYDWWLAGMKALGYKAQTIVLDAQDFGLAQRRKRLFIVFTPADTPDVDLTVPQIDPAPAAAILDSDLGSPLTRRLYVTPQIEEITEPDVTHLVTYRRNAHAQRADQHPLAAVSAGGNHHAIATLQADGTVLYRLLNNRERARAQGFDDSYQFEGTGEQITRMIGNAVPVPIATFLGIRVGHHIVEHSSAAA